VITGWLADEDCPDCRGTRRAHDRDPDLSTTTGHAAGARCRPRPGRHHGGCVRPVQLRRTDRLVSAAGLGPWQQCWRLLPCVGCVGATGAPPDRGGACPSLRCWLGGVEQLAEHGGVAIQRGPAVVGEGDGGERAGAAAGLLGLGVSGVFEFAQVGDQVAGRQAEHVLQAGEGQGVAVGQGCQGDHQAQPGGGVDDRVEGAGAYGGGHQARSSRARAATLPRSARKTPAPVNAQTAIGPANALPAATAMTASEVPSRGQSARAAAMPAVAAPLAIRSTSTSLLAANATASHHLDQALNLGWSSGRWDRRQRRSGAGRSLGRR
jgi:hypothetical protein